MKKLKSTTSFSGELVPYYDLFFDVEHQAPKQLDCMREALGEAWDDIHNILDIGCGTGVHVELLANEGKTVTGLDLSEDMIAYAKAHHSVQNVKFIVDNMCTHEPESSYDLAYAMSHVIGYQLDNHAVEQFLVSIHKTLSDGGYLFFSFYHAPGVYNGKLSARRTVVESETAEITRFSSAEILDMENALLLDYHYLIEEKGASSITEISIEEKMRIFSAMELSYYLEKAGFEIVKLLKFGSQDALGGNDWNGCFLARKK